MDGTDEGRHRPAAGFFRVVGIKDDDSRVTMATGVTRKRAEQVRQMLTGSRTFANVMIEPELPDDLG